MATLFILELLNKIGYNTKMSNIQGVYRKMKKLLCVLLSAAMCICVLAGCGETEDKDEGGSLFNDGLMDQLQLEQEESTDIPEQTEEPTTEEQQPTGSVGLNTNSVTLTSIGQTAVIREGDDGDIYWYSEDSSIAGVCNGTVTAVGNGTTKVHAVFLDQDLVCDVTCNISMGSSRDPIMSAPTYETVDSSFFDDAVFVGDSISLKLSYDTSGRLGNAQFLVQGSYGVGNAIFDVLPTTYRGNTYTNLEDAIAATGAKKLFIMMGMNDIGLYGIDGTIENWGTLIGLIRGVCPDMEIYIQSMTPVWTGGEKGGLTNPNINEYNNKLRVFAAENGCGFIDVAPFMRDATGGLATAFCSDNYVHLSDAGVDMWIKVLKAHAYEAYEEAY